VLYAVVREWLETFLAHVRETYDAPLPRYVEQELRGYLRCGVFAHGFLRARCDTCGHDLLVAFSCKGRAVCPSCAGRRMASVAAQLVDRVLPAVPVRQWVLSLPFELRRLAAFRADVLSALSRIFHDAVFARYATWATSQGLGSAPTGVVCHVQRFGSSINLHVHFHSMVLDGVFTRDDSGGPVFHPAPAPRRHELEGILGRVRRRTTAWLQRHGLLGADAASEPNGRTPLDGCAAVAMQRGSVKVLRAAAADHEAEDPFAVPAQLGDAVDLDGFNLHASVAISGDDDLGRERLMRYGARPPLALERLRLLPGGRIAYRVKKRRDGRAKHRVMTPLEFMARLAALVPPPRYPLLRYAGVLGPRSALRRDIAPQPRRRDCARVPSTDAASDPAPQAVAGAPVRPAATAEGGATRRNESLRKDDAARNNPHESTLPAPLPTTMAAPARTEGVLLAPNILTVKHWSRLLGGILYAATPRVDWATLLRRSFEVDVLKCARCGGRQRVLGEVTEPTAVRLVLESLGVPTEAPRAARARDPTDLVAEYATD
jgi:hypothetical protein